ncbi:MAG: cupin domain-containing protein [Dehalococcoidia bacterium]
MAASGDVIENPVTGERVTFLKTSSETNGELLQWESAFRPGGFVPGPHLHARQEERVQVLSGTARIRLGKMERDVLAGETVIVPRGTAHHLRNESTEELRILAEIRPAMQTETLIETACKLATDGKVDRQGRPNPLRLAVIARGLPDETYLPGLPIAVQKLLLAALAPVGRLLGYKTTYP